MPELDRDQVVAFRVVSQHLDRRLSRDSVAAAAAGGLQDTVPRAALFGLHARVQDTQPDTWEHASLVQTYGPRGAAYVLPRDALAPFTRGLLPRDADAAARFEAVADRVVDALAGGELALRRATLLSRQQPNDVRMAARTGRYVIRWDTSSLTVRAVETPPSPGGDEDARVDLATRFLHWHGPSDAKMFAKWAGINIDDARVTWNGFAGHVAAVDVNGQERVLLAEDVDAARSRSAERPVGVRLLPPNDALFAVDREIVEPEPARRASAFPAYAQPGVVLVDGRLEGTWRRQGRRFQMELWSGESGLVRRVRAEVEAAHGPLGGAAEVEFVS